MKVVPFLDILDDINGEISQTGNLNAYTRLLLLPHKRQIAKVCYTNYDVWERNLANLKLISDQLHSDDFLELVLPTELIEYDGNIVGYLMPYVEGVTFDKILQNQEIPRHIILNIFDQLALVINKLPINIYLGDLHPKNVIVTNDGKVHLIDVDGFSVSNGFMMTCPLYYDNSKENILPRDKYFNKDGSVKIGKNTDIYLLIEMILSWIFNEINPLLFSRRRWRLFLEYLSAKGIPKQVVNMIERLRGEENNYLIDSPFICFEKLKSSISYKDYVAVMKLSTEESRHIKYINKVIEENKNG